MCPLIMRGKNLRMENAGWNFDEIRGEAEKRWNHYLSKIDVEGDNADRITQFYTHLYRTMIHPNVCSDVNESIWELTSECISLVRNITPLSVTGIPIAHRFNYYLCSIPKLLLIL